LLTRPKQIALLAYLAAARPAGFRRRDQIVSVFWPEHDQSGARNALRQAIHQLRAELGSDVVLTRGDEEIAVNPARLSSDVGAFREALADGRLADALELAQGEVLPGFHLSGAPEFERWLDGERDALQREAADAATALSRKDESDGNVAGAAHWARRRLAFMPTDESGLRDLLRLLDRVGDHAGAAREYENFSLRLSRDLEVEPSPETRALVASHRARVAEHLGALSPLPATAAEAEPESASNLRAEPRARTQHSARGSRSRVPSLVAWGVAAAGLVGTVFFATRRGAEPVFARFVAELPESVTLNVASGGPNVALSRDGRRLAVVGFKGGQRAVYVRGLDDPVLRRVRGTDTADAPSFSPDGQWLLFNVRRRLEKVPVTGGTPQVLADSAAPGASWGDGDKIVYQRGRAIWIVSSDGANRRQLTAPDTARRFTHYYMPEVLPGGRAALITISSGNALESIRLGVVSLEDGSVSDLGIAGSNAHYASGHIVFARAGGLVFAVPFAHRKRAITGAAVRVLQNVVMPGDDRAEFAVAANGTLAFGAAASAQSRAMFRVDRQGVERQLNREMALYNEPRVSPDGRRIAARIGPGLAEGDIWLYDVATGHTTRLTANNTSIRGEWSADGQRIVYTDQSSRDSTFIVSRPWDGSGTATVLLRGPKKPDAASLQAVAFGPAHGWSALRIGGNSSNPDIWLAPTDTLGAMRPFIATTAVEHAPRVSPHGNLLAYVSNTSGRNEVYVAAIPGPGPRVAVSTDGGTQPVWGRDGTTLYYRGPARLMFATISGRSAPEVVRRDSLFIDRYDRNTTFPAYDVFPDGQTFVMTRTQGTRDAKESTVLVVVNWLQILAAQKLQR
jgi:DNA-binding SARP family transcriptional activator/Tol biopolymer transport system component